MDFLKVLIFFTPPNGSSQVNIRKLIKEIPDLIVNLKTGNQIQVEKTNLGSFELADSTNHLNLYFVKYFPL